MRWLITPLMLLFAIWCLFAAVFVDARHWWPTNYKLPAG
jgi:hypothetical protein